LILEAPVQRLSALDGHLILRRENLFVRFLCGGRRVRIQFEGAVRDNDFVIELRDRARQLLRSEVAERTDDVGPEVNRKSVAHVNIVAYAPS
jgi:hypothetical protein